MARTVGRPLRRGAPPRAERRPLPPPQGPLTPFCEALADFHLALGKVCSPNDLNEFQRAVLYGLSRGPTEHAIADLHDWWSYDLEKLRKRGNGSRPAKPRIVLAVERTRRDNLIVEWQPDGDREPDWTSWHRIGAYAGYRPTNELLFLHDFGHLHTRPAEFRSSFTCSVNEHLIAMTAALINDLAERLSHTFEVRFVTELELEWEPRPEKAWQPGGRHVLDWSIVNFKERTRREEGAELEKQLRALGYDGEGFVRLLGEAVPGVTLGDLRREAVIRKVRARLLSHGVALTPKPLARLVELLERYQPQVLGPLRQPDVRPA